MKRVSDTGTEEMNELIREVLRGCPEGRGMDKQSLQAACRLLLDIETTKATLRLLQRGELTGFIDGNDEVVLRTTDVGKSEEN